MSFRRPLPFLLAAWLASGHADAKDLSLLNASYDPTRELYQDLNAAFSKEWQAKTGRAVRINQSHGGSGKQARAVMEGLEADIVTLALAYDIDVLASTGALLPEDWQQRQPNNSSPYASAIVFVVRAGNPKGIKDWDDLIRPGIKVVTPNPKTSGGARWNYLAAWGQAKRRFGGDEAKTRAYMERLFKNVPVLDSGARASTNTFAQRGLGDVLISWENEAFLLLKYLGNENFQIVAPSETMLAEPPVTVVTKYATKHGTLELARAYLDFLYTPAAQELIAKNHYRPRDPAIAEKHARRLPTVKLFTIDQEFGGWKKAQAEHFADGGTFDTIYSGAQ